MSEHYKALTRKYRPRQFEDIVSQEHVSNTLKNAIANNRLSHAYLFCGPRGVGKTTMARVLARTINEVGENVDGEALNNTLNIIEIDAASNNKVEDVHALRERVRIPPQNGKYKVYIIDEVHMLTKQAFNAFLKTLEEPPEHAIFIFATTEPHKILPTILSRCQRFDFRRIKVEEIVSRLRHISDQESIKIDDESLHVIAKKADGALRDALGIMDQAIAFCGTDITRDELYRALNVVSAERMFELMTFVEQQDSNSGLQLINTLLQEGYDIQEFLNGLTEHLRNLYLAKDAKNLYLVEATEETRTKYQKASQAFSHDDLMRMLHIVSDAQFKIRDTQQPRIHLEITMLKLIHMTKTGGLKNLLNEIATLKQALSGKSLPSSTVDQTVEAYTKPVSKPAQEPIEQTKNDEPEQDAPKKPAAESSEPAKPQPAASSSSPKPQPKADTDAVSSPGSGSDNSGIDLFGKPSLRRPQNFLTSVSNPDNQSKSTDSEPPETGQISGNLALAPKPEPVNRPLFEPGKTLYLHDIQNIWPDFLSKAKTDLEQILYFNLQRTKPIDLKNNVLHLECDDSFAYELIEERRLDYMKVLNDLTGARLSVQGSIRQQTQEDQEALDPYTRFKSLQKKDPRLRSIVEIFGAELEF